MSTVITNYQNCDVVMGFLSELPTFEQRRTAEFRLLGAIAPWMPTVELEKAIATVRYGLRIEHATITGERVPDGSTGVMDCVANLPGEERK